MRRAYAPAERKKMKIDWEKTGGLLPVVVQEVASGEVLMLAYMNEEALNLSLETGFAHYFSRTKNRIWKKGEQSGNVQKIEDAYLDCDNDTLLIKVEQKGGTACHTGSKSCFFRKISGANFSGDSEQNLTDAGGRFLTGELNLADENGLNLGGGQNLAAFTAQTKKPAYGIIDEIYHVILERKLNADPRTSYVASLFKKGENAVLKKVGEEATELVMACKDASAARRFENLADKHASESSNLKKAQASEAQILSRDEQDLNSQILTQGAKEQGEKDELKKALDGVVYEAADLCFHSLIALAAHGIHPERVKAELARRFGLSGIEEKNSRQKQC
ncbi:bifunctional phosphoribosyl-AMP cyclohydrolase/phosphoribosyl-ATP diphosphatase HisIE [uncultured Campylobacter sp.]|uniref:bifunctional phosphoribosyl-AMP cyclohydrolase/phosphoribosyl-ATP diphosphatase HisIE n=1 Tax=uncultured Campylobacter sp. TaxID=218934 RepID=UPI0025DD4E9B|nr:bifunctional phosphoribosyl-AMP cyclohydrolase/phosphoribosyl-ATP diphosphatase HisIE [uncultured Campylobacter sp.]